MPPPVHPHTIVLRDRDLTLRPLTERDWPLLARWNRRTDVLRWTEGDPYPQPWPLEKVQRVYREVAQHAYCFIMKWRGAEIGDCWLQRMNLPDVIVRYPGVDLRRIDITIFDARLWSRGIGSRAIRLFARFAVEQQRAGLVFAIVSADNPRSRRAFEKCGFALDPALPTASTATDLRLILRPDNAPQA